MSPTFTSDQLDLYASNDPSQPLIVYVHGGGWRNESKELHAPLADRIRQSSTYSVALVEYRLTTPESMLKHPEHAKDVLAALEYLVNWPGEVTPFDRTRLYLVGHSAGGHLLTSIFLDAGIESIKPSNTLISAVQGIALAAGVHDLDLFLAKFPSYTFVHEAFTQPFVSWNTASYPLHKAAHPWRWHVIHSPGDTAVDFGQANAIYDHLKELYAQQGWDSEERVSKDYTSITTEHHFVRENIFATVVVDWVKKDQEKYLSEGA